MGEGTLQAHRSTGKGRLGMTNKLHYSILTLDLLWLTAVSLLTHLFRVPLVGTHGNAAGFLYLNAASVGVAVVTWTVLYSAKSLDGITQ
jgi:hypothetical protein